MLNKTVNSSTVISPETSFLSILTCLVRWLLLQVTGMSRETTKSAELRLSALILINYLTSRVLRDGYFKWLVCPEYPQRFYLQ